MRLAPAGMRREGAAANPGPEVGYPGESPVQAFPRLREDRERERLAAGRASAGCFPAFVSLSLPAVLESPRLNALLCSDAEGAMNPCEACPLEDKVYECCGRFPETGRSVLLRIDGAGEVSACPYLDSNGRCTIYESRPLACRRHYCPQFDTYRGIGRLSEMLPAHWDPSDF